MYGQISIPLGRGGKYGSLPVNTDAFNETVQRHIYDYGLRQILNDAMADKKDENGGALATDSIVAKAEKRLTALLAGDLRVRREGTAEPADPNEAELHRLVKAKIHLTYTAKKFYADVPKGTKNRMLFVANMRRAAMGLPELMDDLEMVDAFLQTSPLADDLRKKAARNVKEAGAGEDVLAGGAI